MKTSLQRFTRWFNREHQRSGWLWEERYKSVIVESGTAARTMAAYIDLNPVRAGMAEDPAEYRWSSYGEAVGSGKKGSGKKAREGLVRAYFCDQGAGFEAQGWCVAAAGQWQGGSRGAVVREGFEGAGVTGSDSDFRSFPRASSRPASDDSQVEILVVVLGK